MVELAFGAMFAYYTDAGEHGWKAFDWPFDDGGDVDAPSEETKETPSAPLPAEDHAAQIESLARKVKELRGALHDAERAAGRLKSSGLRSRRARLTARNWPSSGKPSII